MSKSGTKETSTVPPMEANNIDKIRDILFGNNMKEFEKRFAKMEERMNHEMAELRTENRKMFDCLESFVKDEVKSLFVQLKHEEEGRADDRKALEKDLEQIGRKLAKHEGEASQAQRDLRQLILDQSKELRQELHKFNQNLTAKLEEEVQDLEHQKTDRTALAALLTEMAIRLSESKEDSGDHGSESG